MSQKNCAVVIYHHPCTDGFAAAWAFKKSTFPELYRRVKYVPTSYGVGLKDVPMLDGFVNDVFILDFSFSRQDTALIASQVDNVLVLDHHKTAQVDLENWTDKPDNVQVIFDMNRSGAGLAWDYFNLVRASRPQIINYVEDRDLWKHVLHASVAMNAPIKLIPFGNFDEFDKLAVQIETDPSGVIAMGQLLVKQKDTYVEQLVKLARACKFETASRVWISGLCVNCTFQFASDVGNELAKISGTFGATYYTDATGATNWSLRSIGDFDVSEIAKAFGGGGHKNAAGFKLFPTDEVEKEGVKVWAISEN
jgi:oligoribonuclease NrnB/cAMP/cGMP phosphodiesterase (DHH superfamily)